MYTKFQGPITNTDGLLFFWIISNKWRFCEKCTFSGKFWPFLTFFKIFSWFHWKCTQTHLNTKFGEDWSLTSLKKAILGPKMPYFEVRKSNISGTFHAISRKLLGILTWGKNHWIQHEILYKIGPTWFLNPWPPLSP